MNEPENAASGYDTKELSLYSDRGTFRPCAAQSHRPSRNKRKTARHQPYPRRQGKNPQSSYHAPQCSSGVVGQDARNRLVSRPCLAMSFRTARHLRMYAITAVSNAPVAPLLGGHFGSTEWRRTELLVAALSFIRRPTRQWRNQPCCVPLVSSFNSQPTEGLTRCAHAAGPSGGRNEKGAACKKRIEVVPGRVNARHLRGI